MSNNNWFEGGQRFRYQGSCIRTLKPAGSKLAYGDERLEELRAQRAAAIQARRGRLRRLFAALSRKKSAA